jgi:hypothetical protein
MEDAYTTAFYDLVKDTQERSGFELPEQIEAYVVMLLANFVDRPNFLPTRSFAEAYLKLHRPADLSAKELGDTCLFVTGVFPTYGSNRGMNRRYYQTIGIGSYEMVAEVMHRDLFINLATHFEFISDFIELTVRNKNLGAVTPRFDL